MCVRLGACPPRLLTAAPTVTYTSSTASHNSDTSSSTLLFTFTFSSSVTGFTEADAGLQAGALGIETSFFGSSGSSTYVLAVSILRNRVATAVSVLVPLAATDPPNRLGSGYTINYVPPSATFTGACLRGCHYRTSDLEFVAQFTHAVAVELGDFALSSVLAATPVLTPASGVATEWRLQVQVTSVPAAGAVFDVGFDAFG